MKTKRVLIVDDDELYASSVRRALEYGGKYHVVVLQNPKAVLDVLRTFRPHVMVLDMLMPGMGWLDVCEVMNDDPLGKTVPIVMLTGLQKESDKTSALRLGVQKYVLKTSPIEEIVRVIESVMSDSLSFEV